VIRVYDEAGNAVESHLAYLPNAYVKIASRRTTVCDSLTLLVAACGARAACDGFGFARTTATTFDVFYWLEVTNFNVLLNSAPNGPDHIDIFRLCLHALSPLSCSSLVAGPERAKNPAGKCPPPDSDPFMLTRRSMRNSHERP
jgi:hypothetical protein